MSSKTPDICNKQHKLVLLFTKSADTQIKQDSGIFNVFACSARTSSPMDKQRPQIDSAYSKGAETTFQGVLIVGGDGV